VRQPLRVLQSFPEPRPTTNPYVIMLRRVLDGLPEVDLRTFTWTRALGGRYDVFHAHWPEILLSGRDPARRLVRRVLFAAFLLRLGVTGTPVVRTAHNVRPHTPLSGVEAFLLRALERRTTGVIRLNEQTPVPAGLGVHTVPHGHYRDWFADHPEPPSTRAHVAFVGLIRPYKNVEGLIKAVREATALGSEVTLEVAGQPADPGLGTSLRRAADGMPQISLRLEHLSDEDLVDVVGRAELVVLPYRELHNSGAALLALSLDRPVLLPDNEVTRQLAAEVGAGWVLRYSGDLTGEKILAALEQARALPSATRPDLTRRAWDRAGLDHLAAYRQARGTSARRGLPRRRPGPPAADAQVEAPSVRRYSE
jgi:beta-1,4-mannosyltransferase